MLYVDVIIDLSLQSLDKTYQYQVLPEQEEKVGIGARVTVPFGRGNRKMKAYVVGISEIPCFDVNRIKALESVDPSGVVIESQLIRLAHWMKEHYGSTMNGALKTVLPVKQAVAEKQKSYVKLAVTKSEAEEAWEECTRKKYYAKERLLKALLKEPVREKGRLMRELKLSGSTLDALARQGIITLESETVYRNPVKLRERAETSISLNGQQQLAVDGIAGDFKKNLRRTYLLHGITGSGKTEVYLRVIGEVVREGYQVIMLIPEIALTYQMVERFYQRFGDQVSILNSRMSQGERYDQYIRAKKGEISIMIGPRSALFTPFERLGMILLDEEQEDSYKSETVPRYHARETALERARLCQASVVLGSATPTVESYRKALDGIYTLYTLSKRAVKESRISDVEIVDLKKELKEGNRSVFSRSLREHIEERLARKEQTMLFLNRRGYAGFVSCRSCGFVVKCPHCDVSLTYHRDGRAVCHYCGFESELPRQCPECSSPYIAAFGTGTQKIEELAHKAFPHARVLRMDMDTTKGKQGHERILKAFAEQEADILVGTQMIVKGHDFPNVTLVGVLAADLSLYAGDYRAAEKTYDLLCQAAGRAGRAGKPGHVVIQTYSPEHYSIQAAARQDYRSFYDKEIAFRTMLAYPPAGHMMAVLITSKEELAAGRTAEELSGVLRERQREVRGLTVVGPAKASVAKIKDINRYVIYMKHQEEAVLLKAMADLTDFLSFSGCTGKVSVSFDMDPVSSY